MRDAPSGTYQFGEFLCDPAKRTLTNRENQTVSITPKAFDTLVYLLFHPGTLLDKEELMNAIWPNTVVEENNLNQSISVLRRALGEFRGERRYIATIPGRGYRFLAEVRVIAPEPTTDSRSSRKSIAVLPFRPLVDENRDAALEMGMADTLIAKLSSSDVIVRPISSVRRYSDLDQDPMAAGRELDVESVLEGSIQRWGDYIRVTVRLMSVATGAALWTGTFDEKFTNIFAVQDAIAERVAGALAFQLSQEARRRLTRRYTNNTEAYELYLRGCYHVNKLTPADMQAGISYFQRAIAIDSSYTLSYVGLANVFLRMPVAGEMRPGEFFPKAKEAAHKAIEIDEHLAGAHAALGWITFWYDWKWDEAEGHFRRALELDRNNADSHLGYSHVLSNKGRHEQALAEVERARELDPLNLLCNALEGQFLLHAGQADEALTSLQKTSELEPRFWLAHLFASSAYIERGRFTEAVAEADKATDLSSGSTHATSFRVCALAKSGNKTEARSVLERLLTSSTERYVPPYHIALACNCLGESDEALVWLERGYQQRDPKMVFLNVEPKWNNLRGEARFQDLLKRVGFDLE
jgi:DNA-binding winged helix-turn-helix (wHTH) protein/tetratricopeptide (TPR) repeat protein